MEPRPPRLLDELERRADAARHALSASRRECDALRARVAELEASRLELTEENRELGEQNRELEEHNRHLHDRLMRGESGGGFMLPARRAQGLAALIGHRPRVQTSPPEPEPSAAPLAAEAAGASGSDAGPEAASGEAQGDLPIEPAPSPQALLGEWYRRYPATFFKGHTRPLKIGIHEELTAREPWPEKLVRRALAGYVNLPRYLKSVREGAERLDLDGHPAGAVDADAAEHARKKLERLAAQRRERTGSRPRKAGPAPEGDPRKRKPAPKAKPAAKASKARSDAPMAKAEPATLEEKLSALLAKHNRR